MAREFMIKTNQPNSVPVVLEENDTLGIIGELLRLVSQLDLDEEVDIVCIDQY